MDAYRNPLYPTPDHVIPAAWFDLAMDALPHLRARDGVAMLQAFQSAYASCRSEDRRIQDAIDDLYEEARAEVVTEREVLVNEADVM